MKTNIEWVFLLLETENKEMIFVKENNEKQKPRKRQGQYFIPAWTQEPGEDIQTTIHREFEEETWLNGSTDIVTKTLTKIWELLLETKEFQLKAHVYKGSIPTNASIKEHKYNSEEIESIQLIKPELIIEQTIKNIRPWLIEAILLQEGIASDIIQIEDGNYKDLKTALSKQQTLQWLYKQRQWF